MKYTKDILTIAVSKSKTFADCLRIINGCDTKIHGGSIDFIKKKIIEYAIDFSHFDAYHHMRGNNIANNKLTKDAFTEKYLIKNSNIITFRLKERLFKFGIKENKCEACGLCKTWNKKPITLQVDHKNGNRNDNRIENIRILCPNCHSQTDNYCGNKNKNAGMNGRGLFQHRKSDGIQTGEGDRL